MTDTTSGLIDGEHRLWIVDAIEDSNGPYPSGPTPSASLTNWAAASSCPCPCTRTRRGAC